MRDELRHLRMEIKIRDRKIAELKKFAFVDSLVGVYNRRGFLDIVHGVVSDVRWLKAHPDSRREHYRIDSLSVLFFDIDRFKKLNDTFGHSTGDQVLKFVASIIAAKVRASDIVGRWGGEELIALLVGANERDGFLKAEEIRKAVKSRVRIPRTDERVTVSIGVAELDGDTLFDELVKRADAAMYRAKSTGRDRVMRFSDL